MKRQKKTREPEFQADEILIDVWRCSKCNQDRLPLIKDAGTPNEKYLCTWCGAEYGPEHPRPPL